MQGEIPCPEIEIRRFRRIKFRSPLNPLGEVKRDERRNFLKKKFFGIVLVMAAWAAGSYALGRHHGATKGPMEIPAVHIQWKGEAPTAEQKEVKAEDSVVINHCEPLETKVSGETVKQ